MVTRTLTPADNGANVSLSAGDRLVVRLDENATTGYQWKCISAFPAIAEVTPARHLAPSASAGIGAGGSVEFAFEAKQPGSGTLSFAYGRSWESEAAKRFEVSITVS